MSRKKVIKALDKLLSKKYSEGFSDGWDLSREEYEEDQYGQGWADRSENVNERLNGLFEAYTAARKWKEAEHVKEIIEYLSFVVPPFDEEKYRKDLDNEGF